MWNFHLSIRFFEIPCMFKVYLKSNTSLKLFTVFQLFTLSYFFFKYQLSRFSSISQAWNFHLASIKIKYKDSLSFPAYSKFIWKLNTSLKEFSICLLFISSSFFKESDIIWNQIQAWNFFYNLSVLKLQLFFNYWDFRILFYDMYSLDFI